MSSAPISPKKRPGLPLWIKVLLVVGAVAAVLGLLLTIVPVVAMFWLMGSGDQVDTRALASSSSLAVLQLELDPDDPGVAAFLDHIATTLPELQARLREAQGYPPWLAQLEAMRDARNTQAGVSTLMPTQFTLAVEPADPDDQLQAEPSLLGAVNLPSWGRGARVGMWLGARMQDELADADPELQALQRLEVDDNTLYVQRSASGEVFWGAIDSTLLGGAGSFHTMVLGMERMIQGQLEPLSPQLQAAVDALGPAGWEAWGAMLHQPATVDMVWPEPDPLQQIEAEQARVLEAMIRDGGGEVPEGFDPAQLAVDPDQQAPTPTRSCLAGLEGLGAVAFGLDVVGPDELSGRLVLRVQDPMQRDDAQACAREACQGLADRMDESELSMVCSYELVELVVVATGRVTGIEAATQRFIETMEEQAARERLEAQQRQLPPELQDIPELEGLGFD